MTRNDDSACAKTQTSEREAKPAVLREERVVEDGHERHDLRPAGLGQRRPRSERATGDVLELERREAEVRTIASPPASGRLRSSVA